MRTSEEIYHRVRWDPRLDPSRWVFGVLQRGRDPKRVPLTDFEPGGDVPWHRVAFAEADGERVWDRATGTDRIDDTTAGRVRAAALLTAPFFTARTPLAWNGRDGWHPAPYTPPAAAPAAIRLVTWNTLWDRYESERVHTAVRRPLLLAELARTGADVIALQEVEPRLLGMLMAEPWVRGDYTIAGTAEDAAAAGLVLLSRLPVREAAWHALRPHKAVAAITVDSAAGPFVIATTHLTSDHSENGAGKRRTELAGLAEGLATVTAPVALAGDLNDRGPLPAETLGLRDAWTEAHGDDDTPTFDPSTNPLAAIATLTGEPGRIDRVLLRGDQLAVAAIERIGVDPVDGLHPSDHFGLRADLAPAPDEPPGALGATATARTALAWIPPAGLWPDLQEVRRRHDPGARRWPPHVNVLFGFVPEAHFERAAALLAEALAGVAPFPVRLGGVRTFDHRDDTTIWLDPAGDGWADLHRRVRALFPGCTGRPAYVPHLTVGRTREPGRLVPEIDARLRPADAVVGELVLLSRRGDEPMRPRAAVALGTGAVDRYDEPASDPPAAADPGTGAAVAELVRTALPEAEVHLAGSRALGCALPGADVDLVARVPAAVPPDRVAALPGAADVRAVVGARVPGLRFRLDGTPVDLTTVTPASAPEDAAVALGAVTDARALAAAAPPSFPPLARAVKAWARARGLDDAPFGTVPGIGWAVLAAVTAAGSGLAGADLLRHFFATWAAWDWRTPVALNETDEPTGAAMTILTPSPPVRSCTPQVAPATRDLIAEELYRAWDLLESDAPGLLAPPPMHRRHAAWAVLTAHRAEDRPLGDTLGRMRGRVRALLAELERAGAPDAHAWPRPFAADAEHASYAVGLGRRPPSDATLAGIAGRWTAGLPGVTCDRAAGGAVPTLR